MKNRSKVCWDSGWIELGPIHCFDGSNAHCYAHKCELKRSVFIKSLELQKQYTTSYGFYSLNKSNSLSNSNQSPSSLIYICLSLVQSREKLRYVMATRAIHRAFAKRTVPFLTSQSLFLSSISRSVSPLSLSPHPCIYAIENSYMSDI